MGQRRATYFRKPLLLKLGIALLVVGSGIIGCGGGSGGSGGGGGEADTSSFSIFVSNNGDSNRGIVESFNQLFQALARTFDGTERRFVTANNEGVDIDFDGNLFQAGDVNAGSGEPGSVRVISNIADRGEGDGFNAVVDRILGGTATTSTGLIRPKGIDLAHGAGYLLVADVSAGTVLVFGSSAAGDVPPVAITPIGGNPWDLHYDEASDQLFVPVTNGTLEIFDSYIASGFGPGGASRVVTPADAAGAQVSRNLHGVAYDASGDRIVVSDVGAANTSQGADFASDGQIFVFNNASSINGPVVPNITIAGPDTLLGNPVDIILTGDDLRVAEKANDQLLVFARIFNSAGGNVPPDLAQAQIKPESLVARVASSDPDVTDINDPSIENRIASVSNPGGGAAGTGEIVTLSEDLSATVTAFNSGRSNENVTFDRNGDAFLTFDDGSNINGGIAIINRLARSRNGEAFSDSRDRSITGPGTGLVSPKGLDVAGSLGLVFVTENNADSPAIRVFGTNANGDVPPAYATDLSSVGRPWDVDYAPGSDTLFVALTNGTVAVYDQYNATSGTMPPARTIVPSDATGAPISVNLHGIIYDERVDQLFLSDVGSAADATDGQLFVVQNASSASGNVPVSVQIGGPSTNLGNPVDIAFDGANLYVAEKSNDLILRFDNIAASPGGDIPPSLSVSRTKPESVALIPSYLSGTPLSPTGSIGGGNSAVGGSSTPVDDTSGSGDIVADADTTGDMAVDDSSSDSPPVQQFAFPGTYPAGDGSCGFSGNIVVQNLDSDAPAVNVTFSDNGPIGGPATPDSFQVTGVIVLNAPDHTCNGVNSDGLNLLVSCTNPQGGSCSQQAGPLQ